ncbi:MAG: hypothetical protein IPK27_00810 [Rhodanobacteraceae bacterium]|nr:hypothetical protein [Rhodanobacteraceae bacterium]
MDYRVYAEGHVPLVHAQEAVPEGLDVDGREAVIEQRDGQPQVWLQPGERKLRYALDLAAQPESLVVPESLRVLSLSVDGKPVFPLNRDGSELWLQRAETTTESDALELTVHRLWQDQLPQLLETRLALDVAGKAREIRLGPAWPDGYELTHVEGDLPAVIEPGRMLRLQVTAGSFELQLHARATTRADRLSFEFPASDWPQQEIWSFAADHPLRVVDVAGEAPIDPAQADVPGEWREYPAFAMASGGALTLAERSRGLGDDANRLNLRRELWLDFDGSGYTVQDRISGRMRQGFRLDLDPPYTLLSASERGEPLLVTSGADGGRGIEVRYPALAVEATARLPWTSTLPAHGWDERLDSLSATLHLPPGYRLLYAGGVDRAAQAWIERWDIFEVFIAAFAVVIGWRLGGLPLAGAVALLAVLGVHESDAPRYSLIALLLLVLGWRSLGAGRLRRALALASLVAALAFAWAALPFAIAQARFALHPQLAEGALPSSWGNVLEADLGNAYMAQEMDKVITDAPEGIAIQAPAPPPGTFAPAARADGTATPATATEQGRHGAQPGPVDGNGGGHRQPDQARRPDGALRQGRHRAGGRRPPELALDPGGAGLRRPGGPRAAARPVALAAAGDGALAPAAGGRAGADRLAAGAAGAPRPRAAGRGARAAGAAGLHGSGRRRRHAGSRRCWQPARAPDRGSALRAACAGLGVAELRIDGERLSLALEVHAAERVLLPMPLDDSSLAEVQVRIDGAAAALRGNGDSPAVGGQRARRAPPVAGGAGARRPRRAGLPHAPDTPDGLGPGLDHRRAARRPPARRAPGTGARSAERGGGCRRAGAGAGQAFRARDPHPVAGPGLGGHRVARIAPADGGFSVRVPLLAGEQPQDPALRVENGVAEITLQPGTARPGSIRG